MKSLIESIYWRSCQYPFYIFINIGLAILFYIVALKYGPAIRSFVYGRLLGLNTSSTSVFTLMLDLGIPFIICSILVVVFSIPLLLYKGIVFNVLGYAFFYWFLFFPIHLIYSLLKKQVVAHFCTIPLFLLGVALLIIFLVSFFFYPNQIKQRYLLFESEKVTEKVRIIHLSDVHAENYGSREEKLIEIVNSLDADVILITGDMFIKPYKYNTRGFSAAVKILNQLDSKHGVYLVEGHHDYNETHYLSDVLSDKITILKDEWFSIDTLNLLIFGATLYSEVKPFIDTISTNHYYVYFSHDPDRRKHLEDTDIDLALFGHTHAGQVYIPGLSYLVVGKYRHGLYNYQNITMYVNSGIGLEGYLAPRIRLFTFPEIVVIDVVPLYYTR